MTQSSNKVWLLEFGYSQFLNSRIVNHKKQIEQIAPKFNLRIQKSRVSVSMEDGRFRI